MRLSSVMPRTTRANSVLRRFASRPFHFGVIFLGTILFSAVLLLQAGSHLHAAEAEKSEASGLRTLLVGGSQQGMRQTYDGTVEAVRQTMIAAQVSGTIVELHAAAGDAVKSGQSLVRLDAREASQGAVAADAQLAASQAQLNLAKQEYERQQQLYAKNYISEAALQQAQARFKSAQAEVNSQVAQAGIARTQKSFNIVQAPYAGVISELLVEVGDIALPGKALMTLYDPAELRVSVAVPQSLAAEIERSAKDELRIEIAGQPEPIKPASMQLLPAADPRTHTRTLRLTLPADLQGVSPGMFARVTLPAGIRADQAGADRIMVPFSAVVRRGEMTGLYVLNSAGKPLLRQMRLGAVSGDQVEILAGLSSGERIALDPQIAAGQR